MHLRNLKPRFLSQKSPPSKVNKTLKSSGSSPPAPPPSPPSSPSSSSLRCKFMLNNKGVLSLDSPDDNGFLSSFLKKTVMRDGMKYQSIDSASEGDRHVMLDNQGRLISLASTSEGFIGITQSGKKPDWARTLKPTLFHPRKKTEKIPVSLSDHFVIVDGKKFDLPDKTLNEFITETTSDETGRFRLHMKRLFRFNEASNQWEPSGDQAKKKSLLGLQADGNVWTVTNDKILSPVSPIENEFLSVTHQLKTIGTPQSNLQEKTLPEIAFDRKIEHYSVSRQGQALVQVSNDDDKIQRIYWIEDVLNGHEKFQVKLPHGFSCRKTAMMDNTVFGIDYRGALQCAPLPSKADPVLHFDSGAMNERVKKINAQIAEITGSGFKVEDIVNVKEDRIHFVVKDTQERRHYITVNADRVNPKVISAWNLTDSMTLDHQKGLTPFKPDEKNVMDLERMGKVTVYDNRPYFLNERTGQWELTNEERSDRLKMSRLRAGLDGHPWMLKDGGIKKLKVRESSNKVPHANNVFVLPQSKKSLSVDHAVAFIDNDNHIKDFATIDPDNLVTLNHFNEITAITEGARRTLSKTDFAHQLKVEDIRLEAIGLDETKSLFLVNAKGQVLTLPESNWRSGDISGLSVVTPPDDETGHPVKFIDLHTLGAGVIGLEDTSRDLWRFNKGIWTRYGPPTERKDMMTERAEVMNKDDYTRRIKGTGMTMKSHLHLGGMEKQRKVKTGLRERMDSFVFRPTLEWPRPLKNVAYGVQHSLAGREGLKHVYQMQTDLFSQLRSVHRALPKSPYADSRTQLEDMLHSAKNLAELELIQDVLTLSEMLNASIDHQSKLVGHHYGLLDENLRFPLRPKIKRGSSGMFNPASSRTSQLTEYLYLMLHYFPMDKTNDAASLFSQMVERQIVMNEQKENVPAGINRDVHDEIGLVKSRLIHDVLISRHLHELIIIIKKTLQDNPENNTVIQELVQRTYSLRHQLWEDNPIKTLTDQGFQNHESLEANYDAIRQMVKAFSKDNHSVNVTTRTVLDAETQDELQQNLIDTLRSMETGENLMFTRSYGVNANLSSYFSSALFIGANASGRIDRAYHMQIIRTDTGYMVKFGRSRAAGGNLNLGMVDNLFRNFDPTHPIFLDDAQHLPVSKTLLMGGGVSLSARDVTTNQVSVNVGETEMIPFIEQLLSGEINPVEMMNRTRHHQVDKTRSQDISLALSAQTSVYITMPFVSDTVQNETAMLRARLATAASVSVVSGSRERNASVSATGKSISRSRNGLTSFDRANVSAQFSLPSGPRIMSKGSIENMTMYVTPSADFHVAIDNRISQKLRVDMDDASEMTTQHIDAITSQLERHFPDNTSSQLIASIQTKHPQKESVTPTEKLKILNTHFSQWYEPEEPDEQHLFHQLNQHGQKSALLALQSLVRMQAAFEKKGQVISRAEFQTTFKNVSRIDHNSLCQYLSRLCGFRQTETQSDRLNKMMKADPHLSEFIDRLRENPHAIAAVTLEFNTSTRDRIERGWADETLSQNDITQLLTDRHNVRLKSVVFTQTVKKSDGFASPNFLLGGSNSATVSLTEHLGSLHFSYSDDNEMTPATYRLKGRIAMKENAIGVLMEKARDSGYVLRSVN